MTDGELKVFLEIAERAGAQVSDSLSSGFRRIFESTNPDSKKYDFCPVCKEELDGDGDCMNYDCPYLAPSDLGVSRFITDAIKYACEHSHDLHIRLLQIRENIENNEY